MESGLTALQVCGPASGRGQEWKCRWVISERGKLVATGEGGRSVVDGVVNVVYVSDGIVDLVLMCSMDWCLNSR